MVPSIKEVNANGPRTGVPTNQINHTNGPNSHPNGTKQNGHANGANGHANGISRTHSSLHDHSSDPIKSALTNGDQKHGPEPVAICGIGFRLPAGLRTADDFWELLESGGDGRGPIPSTRYNIEGFDDTLGPKGAIKARYGYYLEDQLDTLDTSFFSMTKTELERTDPQQRQLLEVVRECLENAGETNYRGKDIGCYVGTFGEDWLQMNAKENQHSGSYIMNGQSDLLIANRVSYEFDLTGPSMVVKTGCSASLVGLHEACRSLQSGDRTGAIVCGTNLIMGPSTTASMTQEGILSPEGSCKTFDASADGFARGEAINAVFVKPLSDALRDGNPIRAIIKNTGTNSDGKSQGLMSPNSNSHEALMKKVYKQADLDPCETAFVECHGTGTPTGDPIETTAVANIFGKKGVFIGSVKPNIGHSEGASGLTSLIKGVLALEHETVPPNIKFSEPNPKIPFTEGKLSVPVKALPWPEDRAKRISINSFGIGGTNAHVILESAKSYDAPSTPSETPKSSTELLVFSANSQESLKRHVANLQKYLDQHKNRLPDLAYNLACRREHLSHRAFSVVKDGTISDVSAFAKVPSHVPEIVMVFSGQGAQWPEMGYDLIQSNSSFREDIRAMDSVLQGLQYPPHWTIEGELGKSAKSSKIHEAALAQPLCTAVQIAYVNMFGRLGISPSAVLGHSSGEIAAAYAADSISLAEAIITAYYRGYVTTVNKSAGGMAAIGLGAGSVAPYLIDGVVIACENSPSSTTISGDLEPLQEVISKIKSDQPDVLARQLKVDMAYHSHHMQRVADQYAMLIKKEVSALGLKRQNPKVTWFSSVTGRQMDSADKIVADYWVSNLVSRVRFSTAVNKLLSEKKTSGNLFLEIGPHSTLAGPLRQICAEAGAQCPYVPSMLRNGHCEETVKAAVGQLYQQGIFSNNFEGVVAPGKVLTDVPAYPYDHGGSFWYESRLSKEWRTRKFGHHRLLGLQVQESSTHNESSWRNVLALEDEPWIAGHKIRNDVVFPFAGYVSMAGEAIRQVTGIEDGYSVKHVVTHTALVLGSEPVEMITTLQKHRPTDSTDSEWYNFSISSYAGSNWIRNCDGQVKASTKSTKPAPTLTKDLPREVDAAKMYNALAEAGFVYGPEFQGLSNVTSSPTEYLAAAEIVNPVEHQNAPFHFHPAAIDATLQLLLVVLTKGLGRNLDQLRLPTVVHSLDVFRSAEVMEANAWANSSTDMGVDCVADNEVVLRLRGLRLSPIHGDDSEKGALDPHAAARLEWYPDVDFLGAAQLFDPPITDPEETRLQEEVTLLCMADSAERLEKLETPFWHEEKFRNWLNKELGRAASNTYPLLDNAADFLKHSPSLRKSMIEERFEKLAKMSTKAPVAEGLKSIWENCEDIFTGNADTLDILMREDNLTEIYNVVSFGHGRFVRLLSETKPTLRILEVGAGTGGTTELMLRDLVDASGNPAYSVYSFTDISAGFFPLAKERFSYAPNMDYRVFDISKDPIEQGFELSSYDLIFAPNVIHATPSLYETLSNLRELLVPRGQMILTELCAVVRAPNYIFGNFSGWWLGEDDGRPDEPYISVERWDDELKAAGFTGVDTSIKDAEAPYQYCAAIVTHAPPESETSLQATGVTLLTDRPQSGIGKQLADQLESFGVEVSACTIEAYPRQARKDKPILSALDLESHFFENISADKFGAFQSFLKSLGESQPVLWLMRPSQVQCKDPKSGYALGFIRTVRTELSLAVHTLEINESEPRFAELVTGLFEKVSSRSDEEQLLPDREFVVDQGMIKLSRYHPFSLRQEMKTIDQGTGSIAKTLEISRPGRMQSLQWTESSLPVSVDCDRVEIDVKAVGLNFKDVSYATAAGVVRSIGKGVQNLAPGDRIYALAPEGCISTITTLPEALCVKIPEDLSFDDAATMPICFATALKTLVDIGGIQNGQTVLIHYAAGGIGHAAIQICKMLGVKIYATVGTEDKVRYLNEALEIPISCIFSSRDTSFYDELMRETGGNGVDLVLNSLSGELLHTSWRCVGKFGKLVELGNRDIETYGKLEMDGFFANRSYCSFDIGHLIRDKPQEVGSLLQRCIDLYSKGNVQPIDPKKVFDATEFQECFSYLQEGTHIGKAIMKIPENIDAIQSSPITPVFQLDSEAAYVLTGGLGGLGKPVATWMVEHGAKSLVFLSRSAGLKAEDIRFFEELKVMGCEVNAIAGQVQDMDDVRKALSSTSRPIKGVVHLAMVLRDAGIMDLTHDDWSQAIAPKVQGAWNLHHTLLDKPLDFFFVASSIITVNHLPGQGNYAAASTFLEAFCQYRHNIGLPASTVNICPIEGAGFVAENPTARKNLKSQGVYFLGEKEFFDYFEHSLFAQYQKPQHSGNQASDPWKSTGQVVMGLRSETDVDDPNDRTNWRRDRRMGIYHNFKDMSAGEQKSSSSELQTFLTAATDDPKVLDQGSSVEYLAHEIARKIFSFMLKPEDEEVDISMTLVQVGLDSLMAIEVRRWWKTIFGTEISVLEIMASGTLEELGRTAAKMLKKRLEGGAE